MNRYTKLSFGYFGDTKHFERIKEMENQHTKLLWCRVNFKETVLFLLAGFNYFPVNI